MHCARTLVRVHAQALARLSPPPRFLRGVVGQPSTCMPRFLRGVVGQPSTRFLRGVVWSTLEVDQLRTGLFEAETGFLRGFPPRHGLFPGGKRTMICARKVQEMLHMFFSTELDGFFLLELIIQYVLENACPSWKSESEGPSKKLTIMDWRDRFSRFQP